MVRLCFTISFSKRAHSSQSPSPQTFQGIIIIINENAHIVERKRMAYHNWLLIQDLIVP